MSKISKRRKELPYKGVDQQKFLSRITKTLYYGKLPKTDSLSVPVTELAAELFSEAKRGKSLDILHYTEAAAVSYNACISPCSLVLALLYLERLKGCNPEYLNRVAPSELFLVSLMVSNKFLHDDGEGDEVFIDQWATSGDVPVNELVELERDFLAAIDWKVFVSANDFWKKLKSLETNLSERQGLKRGWYTYTELYNLLNSVDINSLLQTISYLMAIAFVAYLASVLTIISSLYIASNVSGSFMSKHRLAPVPQVESEQHNVTEALVSLVSDDSAHKCSKQIDAVDVLKTSILLASIKMLPNSKSSNCTDSVPDENNGANMENVTWSWWENPVMNWLTETSKMLEDSGRSFLFNLHTQKYYLDVSMANARQLDMQDHIDEATKIRIQDQMERSWHKEWTDTIKEGTRLLSYYVLPKY